jgi:hypothetical protein
MTGNSLNIEMASDFSMAWQFSRPEQLFFVSFFLKFARGGERTRVLSISFIFSFLHHFTAEPQRLPSTFDLSWVVKLLNHLFAFCANELA